MRHNIMQTGFRDLPFQGGHGRTKSGLHQRITSIYPSATINGLPCPAQSRVTGHCRDCGPYQKAPVSGSFQVLALSLGSMARPPKGNRPPPRIANRVDDPTPETLFIGPRLWTRLGQPSPNISASSNILALKMIPKSLPLIRANPISTAPAPRVQNRGLPDKSRAD